MTTSTTEHPGLHHRAGHGPNGDLSHGNEVISTDQQHSGSSNPVDVEAAITTSEHGHEDAKDNAVPAEEQYLDVTYGDIFKQFSILGWTAFGGPAAHIGLFQRVRPVAPVAAATIAVTAALGFALPALLLKHPAWHRVCVVHAHLWRTPLQLMGIHVGYMYAEMTHSFHQHVWLPFDLKLSVPQPPAFFLSFLSCSGWLSGCVG
jgi:hypothetical protein